MGYDGTIPEELLEQPLYAADAWTATFLAAPTATSSTGCRRCCGSRVDAARRGAVLPRDAAQRRGAGHGVHAEGAARAGSSREAGAPLVVAGTRTGSSTAPPAARRMVNAGSVGRPYEHEPGAYWLRLGPERRAAAHRVRHRGGDARRSTRRLPVRRRHARAGRRDAARTRSTPRPVATRRRRHEVRDLRGRRGAAGRRARRRRACSTPASTATWSRSSRPARRSGTSAPSTDARLLAPLRPRSLRDFLAFEGHLKNAYARLGREIPAEWYEVPAYYKGMPDTVIGPEDEVPWPAWTDKLDHELELAAVIGAGGRDIAVARRARRDLRLHDLERPLGARRAGARAAGRDGTGQGEGLGRQQRARARASSRRTRSTWTAPRMRVRVNGELWGEDTPASMHHTFADMIAYVSRGQTLRPGEVLGSGTAAGGSGLELDRWLRPGTSSSSRSTASASSATASERKGAEPWRTSCPPLAGEGGQGGAAARRSSTS